MISMNRIALSAQRFFEATSKARLKSAIAQVNTVLLRMGREQVEELGYSYEALELGPSAWPWHKTTQDSASNEDVAGSVVEMKNAASSKTDRSLIRDNQLAQGVSLDHNGINHDEQSAA